MIKVRDRYFYLSTFLCEPFALDDGIEFCSLDHLNAIHNEKQWQSSHNF